MTEDLNELAEAIQYHVNPQPMSRYGTRPIPIDVHFADGEWWVRFVVGLQKTQRRYEVRTGKTLLEALQAARKRQERGF